MAHNPHAPQGGHPQGHDPAGSTQMFRAFVDEGAPQGGGGRRSAPAPAGPRVGLIAGVIAGIVVLGAVAWLAFA
ncbi:hypothetical protein [Streptomyces yaizuensis]|uniref:Uncharacterized protein n=1 Tax=Streptomyces yaizuensis TaxID=2989713 RepID=A0ABQ5P281_9ACTN|nr:hypothetical protein [Streptomyces sp. YSPA8]GLF96607.1 hypothetical protein SYYSPA8_19940 [Streptomyces sp. YSPA8]